MRLLNNFISLVLIIMTNWIHIEDNGDITLSHENKKITIQKDDLEWFYKRNDSIDIPEGYHIPTKKERNDLLWFRAYEKWLVDNIDLEKDFAIDDPDVRNDFMESFNLRFNWISEDSEWVIDDWDLHWRYRSLTECENKSNAYALRLCTCYAFINDFNKQHWYSVRLFKD